jgi:hypothetical protein
MSEMYGVDKANRVQQYVIDKCQEAYGEIGGITFLRCRECRRVMVANELTKKGFCKCGRGQYSPAQLTLLEEIRFVLGAFFKRAA